MASVRLWGGALEDGCVGGGGRGVMITMEGKTGFQVVIAEFKNQEYLFVFMCLQRTNKFC